MILMLFTLETQLLSSYFIHMHKSINLKSTDRRVLLVQKSWKSNIRINVFSPQLLCRCFCQGQQRHICEHVEYDPVQREYGDDCEQHVHKALTLACTDAMMIFDTFIKTTEYTELFVIKASSACGD